VVEEIVPRRRALLHRFRIDVVRQAHADGDRPLLPREPLASFLSSAGDRVPVSEPPAGRDVVVVNAQSHVEAEVVPEQVGRGQRGEDG